MHNQFDIVTSSAAIQSFGTAQTDAMRMVRQDGHTARISALMEKNQRLAHEIQLLHNARDAREAVSQDRGESDFYVFYRQGWDMQRRLNTMEKAMNFHEKLLPEWTDTLSYADVGERLDKVQFELQSMAYCLESLNPRHAFIAATNATLDSLVDSGFRLSSDTRSNSAILGDCLMKFDLVTVIHTLALTAVRDWVLNAAFPPLQDGNVVSGLFDSWRNIFLNCGMF